MKTDSKRWLYFCVWMMTASLPVLLNAGDAFQCPTEVCRCGLDPKGRIKVVCDGGGLSDPIPIRAMDSAAEVLVITAPEERLNSLTIGPIFQNLPKLEELRIINSFIPAIGKHTFWGLRTLRILDLSANNISALVESNFRGLITLEELNLDGNVIDSITSAAFRHLSSLKRLSIADNRLTELVPRLFYGVHRLEELELSENPLHELEPEVFRDVRLLKSLRCRRCQLSFINPLLLHTLPDIEILDLGENGFHYLEKSAFSDLKRLRNLYLDGNQLTVVTSGVFTGQNLTVLSLARNKILTLDPMAFYNFSTISLDLSENKLHSIDSQVFVPLNTSLQRLNIGGNPLQVGHLWSSILSPRIGLNLSSLDVSDIRIGSEQNFQPDLFSFVRHVKNLNVSGCSLSAIPAELLRSLPSLRELDLSRNELTSFNNATIAALTGLCELRTIHLHGNPWHCDACAIGPLLKWLNVSPAGRHIRDSCRGLKSNSLDVDESAQPCPVCRSPVSVTGIELPRFDHVNLPACKNPPLLIDTSGLPSKVRVGYETDESSSSRGSTGFFASNLLENPLYLALVCGIGALLLTAVCAAVAIVSRHAASYRTNEDKRKKSSLETGPANAVEEAERLFMMPKSAKCDDVTTSSTHLVMEIKLVKENLRNAHHDDRSVRNNNQKRLLDSRRPKRQNEPKFVDISGGVTSRGVLCASNTTVFPGFEEQAQSFC